MFIQQYPPVFYHCEILKKSYSILIYKSLTINLSLPLSKQNPLVDS